MIEAKTELAPRTDQLVVVRQFIATALKRTAMPERDARAVVLAVDEAISNTIMHGYAGQEEGHIEVFVSGDDTRFSVTIRDDAKRYDTGADARNAAVDMDGHVASGKRRGLGLFIMRKVMDEVNYAYRDGTSNELTLVKYIRPEIPDLS